MLYSHSCMNISVRYITKQIRHRLPIMSSSDGLSEHHAHVYALDLLAVLHVDLLGESVRHHHSLNTAK